AAPVLPKSNESFCRFRCPTPQRAPVKAAAARFHAHAAAVGAHPLASIHTPAARKSFQRAPSPLRRTNTSKAALFDCFSSSTRGHRRRSQTGVVLGEKGSPFCLRILGR